MPPLVLEGDTLGKRQQHYNQLLKKVIAGEIPSPKPGKIIPEKLDIENFLKIDIADNNKDVEYILEVLKSEDMLYVSRAIKRCTWLITDPQYAHIINPEYLHSQLFPLMTSKATSKLMLQIRLHLRDETRVEAFYNHFKDNNLKTAFKWLQYCSLSFIAKEIVNQHEKLGTDMPWSLFKRLCERSFTFLKILCELDCFRHKKSMSQTAMFLINTHTDEFLNLIETFGAYCRPNLSAKTTEMIMKKCPQRIANNFDKYADIIDLETFGKMLKKEDIKDFLLKHVKNETFKYWTFNKKTHIVRHMPEEGRFDFLKKTFIEKANGDFFEPSLSAKIYQWYQFAPFDIALTDLKKRIRSESSPSERNSMLAVLISCASRNAQHTRTVLQYYHDKHINEPFMFKIQFINNLLSQTVTHRYDEKTWNILNNIFCSMEVYIESNNDAQACIETIIVYNVLHNEKVPETIENKFKFSSLKSKQDKYNNEEKDKIFNYLLSFLRNKMQNESINHETELKEAVGLIENVVSLLIDWKKDLVEYPWALNVIKQLTKIQKENNWKVDFMPLFNKNKSWRKLMFEESLMMSPSENTCLNALKHDTGLLTRHKNEMEALRRNDAVSLRRLLRKLRLYWPQTLASEWTDSYLSRLNEAGGHKSLTIGLCTLLPQNRLLEILKKYAPTESKTNWSVEEDLLLSLRKHFAKNAHLARPLLRPDDILPYAQGDYLQYALPSINAILYNVSSARSRQYIPKLLDAPVSLQKHGIRFAFTKLNISELKETLPNIWKSAKNCTIRAVLFKATYELLCKEETSSMIEEIWEILSAFIDNLSIDENKIIFGILGKVKKVPLMVRGKYCMKSHKYLKTLPEKANCESIVEKIVRYTVDIMEYLDEDFVTEILLDSLDTKFTTERYDYEQTMVSYLLSAKTEESQIKRFDRILGPLLDRSFALWKVESFYFVRKNVNDLLESFGQLFIKFVFKKDVVVPIKMFTEILKMLEGKLSVEHHFVLMRFWRNLTILAKILKKQQEEEQQTKSNMTWNTAICADLAESCLQYLWEDIEVYGSSVWLLHADALVKMFDVLDNPHVLLFLIDYLFREEFIESYLVALKALRYVRGHLFINEALFEEIRKKIYFYPSPEVKVHYCREFELDQYFEDNIPVVKPLYANILALGSTAYSSY